MILSYIRLNIKTLLMFLLFTAVFGSMTYVYGLPAEAVGYAFLLCLVISAVAVTADFLKFRAKHRALQQFADEVSCSISNMPASSNLIESDYCEIIRILNASKKETASRLTGQYSSLIDYYTMWAHQIKTPIAAMRLVLSDNDTDTARELRDELQKTEQYVEMVLMYLKLDAGAEDYVIRECSLDSIIKQAVKKYASQFIRKKIRLEYEPVQYTVLTDEKWLMFVIEQIVSNSLKYTRQGFIAITFEKEGVLCIRDSGIGIDAADIPRVFDKGFTGLNGRTDKKATGIGLYLCRRILTALGHDIQISSSEGKGTEVRIDLSRSDVNLE